MAKRSFYQLVWRELHWQRPYTQEQVCDILSHLASTIPRGAIIWEARGHGGYVKHIIGADAAYIRRIESVMKAHGDIRFYPLEDYHRAPVSAARQLVISHTGLILCGCCGCLYTRKYTNAKSGDRPIWICSRYSRYGKSACQSQRISEKILVEKTREILGDSELNREKIFGKISRIIVPEHNHLVYELKNGSSVDVFWDHPSRSLSWTAEMREAARQKALKQHKKGGQS